MHDTDFLHEHDALADAHRQELARFIWGQETVELETVGIDIGSSTSHLLFAKVTLQRQSFPRLRVTHPGGPLARGQADVHRRCVHGCA